MNKPTVSLLTITQRTRNKCLKNLLDFILSQTYHGIIEWIIVEGSKTEKDAEENKEFIINEIIINEIIINEIIIILLLPKLDYDVTLPLLNMRLKNYKPNKRQQKI